jgi:hypothetical protein
LTQAERVELVEHLAPGEPVVVAECDAAGAGQRDFRRFCEVHLNAASTRALVEYGYARGAPGWLAVTGQPGREYSWENERSIKAGAAGGG